MVVETSRCGSDELIVLSRVAYCGITLNKITAFLKTMNILTAIFFALFLIMLVTALIIY